MAKRRGKTIHKKKMTVSLAVIAGLAPTAIMGYSFYQQAQKVTPDNAQWANNFGNIVARWIGYNPNTALWVPDQLKYNLLPAVVGFGIHKVATKLGINRMLSGSGIPFVRI